MKSSVELSGVPLLFSTAVPLVAPLTAVMVRLLVLMSVSLASKLLTWILSGVLKAAVKRSLAATGASLTGLTLRLKVLVVIPPLASLTLRYRGLATATLFSWPFGLYVIKFCNGDLALHCGLLPS
jgi:hypothetical protein